MADPGWEIRLWQPEGHAIAIGEPVCAAEASGAPVGGEWLPGLRGQAEIADKQNTWLLGCGQGGPCVYRPKRDATTCVVVGGCWAFARPDRPANALRCAVQVRAK